MSSAIGKVPLGKSLEVSKLKRIQTKIKGLFHKCNETIDNCQRHVKQGL